jgi:hypothetical protein
VRHYCCAEDAAGLIEAVGEVSEADDCMWMVWDAHPLLSTRALDGR